jgi:hypothetical protein
MAIRARLTPQSRAAVTKRLRELAPNAEAQIAKAQEESAKELAEAIKARAQRKSGRYAESIEAGKLAGRNDGRKPIGMQETKDPNAWGIFASYLWRWIEFGTRPHTIKAKRVSDLVFYANGQKIVTPQVSHPGTTKQSHIFPTYRQYKKRIRRRVLRAIRNAINGKK